MEKGHAAERRGFCFVVCHWKACDRTARFARWTAEAAVPTWPGWRLAAQVADDGGDVVFLEEADGGDAGCAGLEAGVGILRSYAS